MNRTPRLLTVGCIILGGCLVGFAGVTFVSAQEKSTIIDGSRAKVYDSVDSLLEDSSLVVTATVTRQESGVDAQLPVTISAVTIDAVHKSSGPSTQKVIPGSQIRVLQIGTSETEQDYPLIRDGELYLLFLTTSTNWSSSNREYYVTGVWAGVYEASVAVRTREAPRLFERLHIEGDTLPAEINIADLP